MKPCSDVDEVHRAPEPTAEPTVASHQLRHRLLERGALGDRVTMAAVSRIHGVVVAKLRAHANGDAFLARAQVDEAVNLAVTGESSDPLLEQPNPPHRGEQVTCLLAIERRH